MEVIFENFVKFKGNETKKIILDGCLKSKLIKPFLVLFKKLEIESDESYLGIEGDKI